jgi:hypothetical protein
MTKHGRHGQTRYTAPDSRTANPEMRSKKVLAEKKQEKKGQRLLTGLLGLLTPRHVLVLNDFGSEEAVELCGG